MRLDEATCRSRFASARVARLATSGPTGPHIVPFVFAVVGNRILSAVDDKPKRSRGLTRLANIEADPRVSALADYYSDVWTELWWVRADGEARIFDFTAVSNRDVAALVERYRHYKERPPAGPYVEIRVERWRGWAAGPDTRRRVSELD